MIEKTNHITKLILSSVIILLSIGKGSAQVTLQFDRLGEGSYKDDNAQRTGGRSSATITDFDAKIPISYKLDENKQARVWMGLLNTKFTSMHTSNLPDNICPKEIFNLHVGIAHIRPMKKNQTLVLGLILSAYSSHANVWKFRSRNIFYNLAGAYIWQLHDNLKVGGGVIVTMFYGYPLPIPFPYVEWKWGSRYKLNLQFINYPNLTISMKAMDNLVLSLTNSSKGSTAVETIDGQKMQFSHSYMISAVEAEMKYKRFDFSASVGVSYNRKTKFRKRQLKSLFKSNKTNYNPTPYFALGVKYNLW